MAERRAGRRPAASRTGSRSGARQRASRRPADTSAAGTTATSRVMVVNIVPQALSGERNHDSEPSLAVNPANPMQMAASAFTPNPAGVGDAPIYVSNDGGQTWLLNAIVPSDRMTADITLRFSDTTNTLYAGIIRTPIRFDPGGQAHPRLNILRTKNFLGPAKMTVLVDRTGAGVDQPYIQAATMASGAGAGKDVVFVGDNDFNQPGGRSATIDFSGDAAATRPAFKSVSIDTRTPAGGADAPSIRPAIHADGTVYGAFLHQVGGTTFSNLQYDVIVVRDDHFGTGANPFTALQDPGDNRAGRRVVQNRVIPFLPDPRTDDPGPLGQERIGSHITIAVDPRPGQSATAYIAWADRVGASDYTIHLRRSTDRGLTWSPNDLLTITNALNPALAVNSDGKVGFLYQQLTGPFTPGVVTAANRWVTHLRRSTDSINWDDIVFATVPANVPSARDPVTGRLRLPYLGDYIHMQAVGRDFYGIFAANNTPDPANFPNGVVYQRNHDFSTHRLLDTDSTTPVDISIDPFFFKVTE
jgi:hypothetical protein